MQRRVDELLGRVDGLARAQLRPLEHRPDPRQPDDEALRLGVDEELSDPQPGGDDVPPKTQAANEQPQLGEDDRTEVAAEEHVDQRAGLRALLPTCHRAATALRLACSVLRAGLAKRSKSSAAKATTPSATANQIRRSATSLPVQ